MVVKFCVLVRDYACAIPSFVKKTLKTLGGCSFWSHQFMRCRTNGVAGGRLVLILSVSHLEQLQGRRLRSQETVTLQTGMNIVRLTQGK